MPPPVSAHVKDGRMIAGRPMVVERPAAHRAVLVWIERGVPADPRHASRKRPRSSALSMGVGGGADHLDVEFRQRPCRRSDSAQFSAVWPPMVGNSANPPGRT